MNLKGWIEHDGVRLSPADVERMLKEGPEPLKRCGGEFLLTWDDCTARDAFGIMPGPVPPGAVCCGGRAVARIAPDPPSCTLEERSSPGQPQERRRGGGVLRRVTQASSPGLPIPAWR